LIHFNSSLVDPSARPMRCESAPSNWSSHGIEPFGLRYNPKRAGGSNRPTTVSVPRNCRRYHLCTRLTLSLSPRIESGRPHAYSPFFSRTTLRIDFGDTLDIVSPATQGYLTDSVRRHPQLRGCKSGYLSARFHHSAHDLLLEWV